MSAAFEWCRSGAVVVPCATVAACRGNATGRARKQEQVCVRAVRAACVRSQITLIRGAVRGR